MIKEIKNLVKVSDTMYKVAFPILDLNLAINYKKGNEETVEIRPVVTMKDIPGNYYLDLDGDGNIASYFLYDSTNRVIKFVGFPYTTEVYIEVIPTGDFTGELSLYAVSK